MDVETYFYEKLQIISKVWILLIEKTRGHFSIEKSDDTGKSP